MTIKRAKVNIPDKLAGRALVRQPRRPGQQRRFDCRIKRGPRLPRGPAVPDRHKLFGLNGIAPKLALAAFFFGALRCGPLALHSAFVEAMTRDSPERCPIYDVLARSHNATFLPLFSEKADLLCSI